MGKKSKKKGIGTVGLVLLGVGIAVFGQKWFARAVDRLVAGIGYKVSDLKLRLTNITNLTVMGTLTVINTNNIGGRVEFFDGVLKYGKNGPVILPIYLNQFQLPANGSADAQIIASTDIAQLLASSMQIVQAIKDGNYKKLWLTGNLQTSFASVPVDTEISAFSA